MTDKDTTTAVPKKRGVKKGTKRGFYKKSGFLNDREQLIYIAYLNNLWCGRYAVSATVEELCNKGYNITKWGVITVLRKKRKILMRRQLEINFIQD